MIILITGSYGFLGRYVAKEFNSAGHYIIGMGHGDWDRHEQVFWGIDEWHSTTISFEALMSLNEKPDIIIHCGGSASVQYSRDNPYDDYQKTVQGTIVLLEYMRIHNRECKFIYPSSPAVQGDLGNVQIKEEMIGIPVSPYGFHKKIAEELCLSYHKNFGLNIAIIRFFSVYGNGLKKQLLWDACNKIIELNKVDFFGTGDETRDWIHVTDGTALIRIVSHYMNGYTVINAGSGKSIKNRNIIALLCEYLKKTVDIHFNDLERKGDPKYFWADITKAHVLGWTPKVDIFEGLQQYVDYFSLLNHD